MELAGVYEWHLQSVWGEDEDEHHRRIQQAKAKRVGGVSGEIRET